MPYSARMSRYLSRARLKRSTPLAALLIVVMALCVVNQRPGHNWGDDFALYIRQAQGLMEGNTAEVVATNRYTVDESSTHTFSPYAYPWGFPILISPVVAVLGINYPMLKLVETLVFAAALLMLYLLVVRRIGRWGALVLVALIGFSGKYVRWTDTVTSDLLFLLEVLATLWWIDRCRERGAFHSGPTGPLVIAGLLIGYAYSTRREGIVLITCLAAAQFVQLRRRRKQDTGPTPRKRILLPYASTAALVVGLQFLLPSAALPHYKTGLGEIGTNVGWYWRVFADTIGVGGDYLGSTNLALALLLLFVVMAVVGLGMRLVIDFEKDLALVTYLVGAILVVLTLPFKEDRYLFTLTPFIGYFAYQGVVATLNAVCGSIRRLAPRAAMVAGLAAIGFLMAYVAGNATDLYHVTDYRLEYDYIHWGPGDPAAVEMFEQVEERTRRDDVLAFFRARAMTLYTDRTTLQLTSLPEVLAKVDWYVMVKDSTYSQALVTPGAASAAGLTVEWENDRFILWRVPDR